MLAAFLSGGAHGLRAAVIQTNFGTDNGSVPGYVVSGTDVLQTYLSSASRTGAPGSGNLYFYREDSGYAVDLGRLTDGDFGQSGGSPGDTVMPNQTAITFALDLVANPGGYSLTSIRTYAGWDDGRDGQAYSVSYSTATAPGTFVSLFTITRFDAPDPLDFGLDEAHTLVELTDTGGLLAAGVAQIRFTFNGIENGGTGFREFDVIGAPTAVPEPAVAAVVTGAGLLGFAAWRKRRG